MTKMKIVLIFFLCLTSQVFGIAIAVKQDKSSLYIDETLHVEYSLEYPESSPPDLFPFLYELNHAPLSDFQIVSSKVESKEPGSTQLSFTLAPLSTGTLIFSPGTLAFANVPYLVPPITVEALSTGLSALPIANMLPLYPERRIELSPEMRIKLMSDEVVQKAKAQIQSTFEKHRKAWTLVLVTFIGLPFSLLFLWGLIFYELIQRSLRKAPTKPTFLQQLLGDIQKENLPPSERWETLAQLVREALGSIEEEDFEHLDLKEVRQKIAASSKFMPEDLEAVLLLLDELVLSCYAGKPLPEAEWHKAKMFVQDLLKKYFFNKSHQKQNA